MVVEVEEVIYHIIITIFFDYIFNLQDKLTYIMELYIPIKHPISNLTNSFRKHQKMSEHKNNEVLDSDGLVEVIIESDEPSDTSCSDDEQLHSIPVVKKISKFIKMIKCLILCLKDTKNYLW
jgi:hypothetical protein